MKETSDGLLKCLGTLTSLHIWSLLGKILNSMLDTWSCHWQAWTIKIIVKMPPSGDLFTEQTDNSCRPWLQRNARKVQTKSETLSDPNLCNSQLSLNRANYLPRFQLYPFVRGACKKLPRSCSSNNKVLLNCIPCKLASSWRFSLGGVSSPGLNLYKLHHCTVMDSTFSF